MILRICAWCCVVLDVVRANDWMATHTICPDCRERVLPQREVAA